ncbi:MAG: histidinol-phosphate transaminase [Anaerolineales bacterium]
MQLPNHIANLPPYIPIEPFEVLSKRVGRSPDQIIKLDANENPYGMSPRAQAALVNLPYGHIYPDPESRALRTALSTFTGAPAENLLAGAGADELIDLIMRVTLNPGDAILNCPPTFGMYAFDADLNNAKIVNVPRKTDFSVDVDGVLEAAKAFSPKLIFLTSPNNPDGSLLPEPTLQKLLALPALIILDEAYVEFAAPESLGRTISQIVDVPNRENLIVLRTFSKLAGLAGLRVGYGAFPSWLMPTLWKAKQPYNVNVAASTAALAALEDTAYLTDTVSKLVTERQRLFEGLSRIDWLSPYPSNANFILCRVTGHDAAQLKADLAAKHGIFIRYFNKPGLDDHIRISVGKPEQTDALLKALLAVES